jgi:hypothetical protein
MTSFSRHESARLVEVLCDPSLSSIARALLRNNEGDNSQNGNRAEISWALRVWGNVVVARYNNPRWNPINAYPEDGAVNELNPSLIPPEKRSGTFLMGELSNLKSLGAKAFKNYYISGYDDPESFILYCGALGASNKMCVLYLFKRAQDHEGLLSILN